MNRFRYSLLTVLWVVSTCMTWAQRVNMRQCEYWFDYQFDTRQAETMTSDTWTREFDLSALPKGIHVLGVRFQDSEGRWGSPILQHFLIPEVVEDKRGNVPARYEYWIDYQHDQRKTGNIVNGGIDLTLDMSNLHAGIHTLHYQVTDSRGLYGAVMVNHFLIPEEVTDKSNNIMKSCRYWIDYDVYAAKAATLVDGTISLELDVSKLHAGIHTLHYQVTDSRGLYGSAMVRHFLIPEEVKNVEGIVAYEYWFNHGPRTHVNVNQQNPLNVKDLWVDIKDVIPNRIPADYRFLVDKEKVEVDDNVYFGIQAFDNAGHPSSAVLSDTFQMVVPVDPHFLSLKNGEVTPFTAPDAGQMQGFKVGSQLNDSLYFTLSDGEAQLDFYDATGKRLEVTTSQPLEGQTLYALQVSSSTTYVLVYNASAAIDKMNILVENKNGDGLEQTLSDGISIAARGGQLLVTTPQPTDINIVSAAGILVKRCKTQAGLNSYPLTAGIYVVQLGNGATRKVVVK